MSNVEEVGATIPGSAQRCTAGTLQTAFLLAFTLGALGPVALGAQSGGTGTSAPDSRAPRDIVERAVDLSGGEATLRGVRQVALRMMTQWQRPSFRQVPYRDRPSFEPHTDVRDYTVPAWRNTREFTGQNVTNIVTDSVAVTDFGRGFQPLSVAYVDEREELFTYTPDRLLLALLDAPDLAAGRDTLLGGEPHWQVSATLSERFPSTVFFHQGTGLPTALRFRAAHPADFGLVPWGVMTVEVWYSGWRTFGEISIPTQWDITRVGEPYKRMTVRNADFAPELSVPDSFAINSELRQAYWSSPAPLPMHEGRSIEERTLVNPGRASLQPPFGFPSGAVAAGDGWMVLGAGQTPFNWEQGIGALEELGVAPVTSVLVGEGSTGNGGVRAAAALELPIYVSVAAEPFVVTMLEEAGLSSRTVVRIDRETVIGQGNSEVRLAPVDLPDVPGSVMLHRPSTGWLHVPGGRGALSLRLAHERAAELGWNVVP